MLVLASVAVLTTLVASVHPDLPFRSLAIFLGLVPCQGLLVGGLGGIILISVRRWPTLYTTPLFALLIAPYCKIHDDYALETTVL
jgi:hypothetical protein